MAEPNNGDILVAIGKLQGAFGEIKDRLDRADDSRKALYDTMASQNQSIANLEFQGKVQSDVAVQIRDEMKGIHAEHADLANSVKPIVDLKDELPAMVEVWKDMNKWSKRLVWVLGLGGLSTLGVLVWFGNAVVDGARHILRIP